MQFSLDLSVSNVIHHPLKALLGVHMCLPLCIGHMGLYSGVSHTQSSGALFKLITCYHRPPANSQSRGSFVVAKSSITTSSKERERERERGSQKCGQSPWALCSSWVLWLSSNKNNDPCKHICASHQGITSNPI